MTKYIVRYSSTFKKKLKKIIKRGKDINKLIFVVERLANKEDLELKQCNHNDNQLILLLVDTGSHSDLF